MGSKIDQLLQAWPAGVVGTQCWLTKLGLDFRLADKYVRSGWLERLGHGAYIRAGSTVFPSMIGYEGVVVLSKQVEQAGVGKQFFLSQLLLGQHTDSGQLLQVP